VRTGGDIAEPIDVDIRWADVDAYGHVHHIALVGIAEHGRSRWLDRLLRSQSTWPYAVVRLAVDFRSPAFFEEHVVRCSFRVLEVGTSSVRLAERLAAPDGREIAAGETVIVAWDIETMRPRPLSATECERLGADV